MFDETNDVQMRSLLNVFMNILFTDGTFQTIALTLSELDANDADTVYKKLVEVLTENNIDMQLVTGICSDCCSVMLGKWMGVCTCLSKAIQHLRKGILRAIMATDKTRSTISFFHPAMGVFVVHCVCHRFALILHDAIKAEYVDPDFVLLLQMLYTYFGRSPRRKLALRKVVKAHIESIRDRMGANAAQYPDPDDAMHAVFKDLGAKHRLPPRIVLTQSVYNPLMLEIPPC